LSPRLPLFPYTTLFRSQGTSNPFLIGLYLHVSYLFVRENLVHYQFLHSSYHQQSPLLASHSILEILLPSLLFASQINSCHLQELDRKSTRLNSTHVSIS